MSYYSYLVDEKEKLIIKIGNHISEEIFDSDYKLYKKFRERMTEISDLDEELFDAKVNKLSLRQLNLLVNTHKLLLDVSTINSSYMSLDYKWTNENNKLIVIGEENLKLNKYKDYKRSFSY